MPLLESALDRQVLRQAGAVYQFRHADLQDRLADRYESGSRSSHLAKYESRIRCSSYSTRCPHFGISQGQVMAVSRSPTEDHVRLQGGVARPSER